MRRGDREGKRMRRGESRKWERKGEEKMGGKGRRREGKEQK